MANNNTMQWAIETAVKEIAKQYNENAEQLYNQNPKKFIIKIQEKVYADLFIDILRILNLL